MIIIVIFFVNLIIIIIIKLTGYKIILVHSGIKTYDPTENLTSLNELNDSYPIETYDTKISNQIV